MSPSEGAALTGRVVAAAVTCASSEANGASGGRSTTAIYATVGAVNIVIIALIIITARYNYSNKK